MFSNNIIPLPCFPPLHKQKYLRYAKKKVSESERNKKFLRMGEGKSPAVVPYHAQVQSMSGWGFFLAILGAYGSCNIVYSSIITTPLLLYCRWKCRPCFLVKGSLTSAGFLLSPLLSLLCGFRSVYLSIPSQPEFRSTVIENKSLKGVFQFIQHKDLLVAIVFKSNGLMTVNLDIFPALIAFN